MSFLSLTPFVPSEKQWDLSKAFFLELGFQVAWEAPDMVGFEQGHCSFILQRYDEKSFAENFMLTVKVADLDAFWEKVQALQLSQKYPVRFTPPQQQPWGREVVLIDLAGVCWHFTA